MIKSHNIILAVPAISYPPVSSKFLNKACSLERRELYNENHAESVFI